MGWSLVAKCLGQTILALTCTDILRMFHSKETKGNVCGSSPLLITLTQRAAACFSPSAALASVCCHWKLRGLTYGDCIGGAFSFWICALIGLDHIPEKLSQLVHTPLTPLSVENLVSAKHQQELKHYHAFFKSSKIKWNHTPTQ